MYKTLVCIIFLAFISLTTALHAYADNAQCKDCITNCAYRTIYKKQFEQCFLEQCKPTGLPCSHISLERAINFVKRQSPCISACTQNGTEIEECQNKCSDVPL